jgi:hypothetical protein
MEDEIKQNESVEMPKTAFDRVRNMVESPDFQVPQIKSLNDVMLETPMPMDKDLAHKMVDMAQIRESAGEQSAVAIENFLTNVGGFGDRMKLGIGQYINSMTGNTIGKDWQDAAYKSMNMRLEDMAYAEDAVGGMRSKLAKLVSGATSMAEYAILGLVPYVGLGVMGADVLGESAYNDMKAYADEHDGSLEGYVAEGKDVALNTLNAIAQTAIERYLGVANPRFFSNVFSGSLKSAVRKGLVEGASGFAQESSQSALTEVNEWLKGHQEWQDVVAKSHQYIEDGVIGAILQGGIGGAIHFNGRLKAQQGIAETIAKSNGRDVPNKKDQELASKYVDNHEQGVASAITNEVVDMVDGQTASDKTPDQMNKTITTIGRALNERGIATATEDNGVITVNTPNSEKGTIDTEIYVPEEQAQNSQFFTPDSEFKVESGKKSASKLQASLKAQFGDKVKVDKLQKMSVKDTVAKATERIEQNKQSVVDLLNDKNANKLDRATAYHALAQQITDENDIDILRSLSDPEVAKFGRELGQAVAMLDIQDDTGFNVIDVALEMRNAKGEMTEQQLNDEIGKIGLDKVKLSDQNIKELKQSTECEL